MSRSFKRISMTQFIDFEVVLMGDYIDYVESFFRNKENEIHKNFEHLKNISDDDPIRDQCDENHQIYYDVLLENLVDDNFYLDEFSNRFRESLVIQIHSFYEKHINKIIDYFLVKNAIMERSLKGNYTEKVEQILKTQLDVKKIKGYDFLINFTELRNCIIHNEGRIKSSSKFVNRLNSLNELKKQKLISLKETVGIKSSTYEVVLENKEFMKNSLSKISDFLKDLDENLSKHY